MTTICTGKAAFPTRQDAEKLAKRMRRNADGACRLSPYKCEGCGQYHVGNRKKARRR